MSLLLTPISRSIRARSTVLACLFATRPVPGRSFKSPTTTRLFVTVPDLRAEFLWKPSMATGTVKWFNPTKGFGFIQPEDGGNDVFVHISAVERAGLGTLNEGQRISYEVVTERGKQAADNLKDPE